MKKVSLVAIFLMAFMAVSAYAAHGDHPGPGCPPGHEHIGSCNGGDGGSGGDGGNSSSDATGVGIGVGVGIGQGGNATGGNATSDSTANVSDSGNSNVDNTNTAYGGDGGSANQGQGQDQGQQQGQQQGQVGINISETNVTDNSVDAGNTLIIGGGQDEEGGSTLSPTATATNEGNNSTNTNEGNNSSNANNTTVNIGEDGPLTASSQTVEGDTVNVEGDTTNYEAPIIPVNSAATSFASICTSGASGQRTTYGVSLAVTSDVCTHLMMADAYMAVGNIEKAVDHVEKAGRHASFKGFFGYIRNIVTLGIL